MSKYGNTAKKRIVRKANNLRNIVMIMSSPKMLTMTMKMHFFKFLSYSNDIVSVLTKILGIFLGCVFSQVRIFSLKTFIVEHKNLHCRTQI